MNDRDELERKNHDSAPAAIAPEPEPEPAARRRPAGGTGDTVHGASPEARASVGRPRTNNADLPICAGTGDTPVAEPATTAEPVAWGVANGSRVLATSISRMDAVDMQGDYAYHTEIVPLYRSPTLTDAERKAVETCIADDEAMTHHSRAATLRGLLERLGGGR